MAMPQGNSCLGAGQRMAAEGCFPAPMFKSRHTGSSGFLSASAGLTRARSCCLPFARGRDA